MCWSIRAEIFLSPTGSWGYSSCVTQARANLRRLRNSFSGNRNGAAQILMTCRAIAKHSWLNSEDYMSEISRREFVKGAALAPLAISPMTAEAPALSGSRRSIRYCRGRRRAQQPDRNRLSGQSRLPLPGAGRLFDDRRRGDVRRIDSAWLQTRHLLYGAQWHSGQSDVAQ